MTVLRKSNVQRIWQSGSVYSLPPTRRTIWQPGVTYNSIPSSGAGNTVPSVVGAGYGIPTNRTVATTLSPIGGNSDDTAQINAAISAASSGQIVQLTAGVFNINGIGILHRASGVTLRGSGPGKGLSAGINAVGTSLGSATFTVDSSATQLVKQDRATNPAAIITIGWNQQEYTQSTLLTANAIQGNYSVTVASTAGLAAGQIVLIDHNTANDPNVYWGNNNDPAGAEVTASVSGTVLTVTQVLSGTVTAGSGPADDPSGMQLAWTATGGGNPGNYVTLASNGTGSGGTGTYNLASTPSGAPYASQMMGIGYGTRRNFGRQDRSVSQNMEIASIVGNTVTFTTPFHYTYLTANNAQLTQYYLQGGSPVIGAGIENLMCFGGAGNIFMGVCAYSWIKNIEAAYADTGNVAMYGCFRCELRDSFIHESDSPNPGGSGYLIDIAQGSADCLIENNISWNGNKNIVMRGTGGGNVVGYNYFDDAFGSTYPQLPEAGLNAAHAATPFMELLEGNYSHNFTGDSFWGGSINIAVFRNHFSTLRVAAAPLNAYTNGGHSYGDYGNRFGLTIQAGSYFNSFVGNVIGFSGTNNPPSATSLAEGGALSFSLLTGQTSFIFENLTALPSGGTVPLWNIGEVQSGSGSNSWNANSYTTLIRDGNWDWFTQTQTWLGLGGTQASPLGVAMTLPNSLYLTSAPPFFGNLRWPWVDPTNGSVYVLPAKKRFSDATYNSPIYA
jgi:hypothetical protein